MGLEGWVKFTGEGGNEARQAKKSRGLAGRMQKGSSLLTQIPGALAFGLLPPQVTCESPPRPAYSAFGKVEQEQSALGRENGQLPAPT